MAFIRYAGTIVNDYYGYVMNDIISNNRLYIGKQADAGWYVYLTDTVVGYKFVMTKYLYYCLQDADGNLLECDYDIVNQRFTFNNGQIYNVNDKYYIFDEKQFVGQIPTSITTEEDGVEQVIGDGWYQTTEDMGCLQIGDTLTFRPQGTMTGENKVYTVVLPSFVNESGGLCGVYVNLETGEQKYFGTPIFTDGTNNYPKSIYVVDGYHTYGNIKYVDNEWKLGSYIGEQPQLDRDVEFVNPDDSTDKITISFLEWQEGTETTKIFVGDVARW